MSETKLLVRNASKSSVYKHKGKSHKGLNPFVVDGSDERIKRAIQGNILVKIKEVKKDDEPVDNKKSSK